MKLYKLQLTLLLSVVFNSAATVRYVDVNSANPQPPYTGWSTAALTIQDAVDEALSGDLVLVTNGTYATGGRAVYGTMTNRVAVNKMLTVQSINGPQFTLIQGWQLPGTTNGEGAIRCVYLTNGANLIGFTLTNGGTRVENDPANTQDSGGGLWCESTNAGVLNCVLVGNSAYYDGGGAHSGTLSNCTLRANSVKWFGGGAENSVLNNCTLIANTALFAGGAVERGTLNNCVLTGNSSGSRTMLGTFFGGGASLATLNNCVLSGNAVHAKIPASALGGGAYTSTLNNCILTGNSAGEGGGGLMCTLTNCTLVANSAEKFGGGVAGGTLNNCILYYNNCTNGANYVSNSASVNFVPNTLEYCCTTPQPPSGLGNITNEPIFIDLAGVDLRLQSNSPCIDSGNSAYAPPGADLDGNPRIVGGVVDMGAYELQRGALNLPASISCPAAATVECGSPAEVTIRVNDPEGDSLTVLWTVNGQAIQTDQVTSGNLPTERTVSLSAEMPLGTNIVTVLVTDTATNNSTCSTTVTVVDTTRPVIVSAAANPSVLWPPNHQMVAVQVRAQANDICGAAIWKIIRIRSNELVNGHADGKTSADWVITGDHTVNLRAEHSGSETGRIYSIIIQATDTSGNLSETKAVSVSVPKSHYK